MMNDFKRFGLGVLPTTIGAAVLACAVAVGGLAVYTAVSVDPTASVVEQETVETTASGSARPVGFGFYGKPIVRVSGSGGILADDSQPAVEVIVEPPVEGVVVPRETVNTPATPAPATPTPAPATPPARVVKASPVVEGIVGSGGVDVPTPVQKQDEVLEEGSVGDTVVIEVAYECYIDGVLVDTLVEGCGSVFSSPAANTPHQVGEGFLLPAISMVKVYRTYVNGVLVETTPA